MNWIDFEKEQPVKQECPLNDYYLCKIWGFTCNDYWSGNQYHVCYWDGKKFTNSLFQKYPIIEWSNEHIVVFYKVVWWCKIDEPPRNRNHNKSPEELENLYPEESTNES